MVKLNVFQTLIRQADISVEEIFKPLHIFLTIPSISLLKHGSQREG